MEKMSREFMGWMRAVPPKDDYTMFINEQPEGGFGWKFYDFEPAGSEMSAFKPIYISLTPRQYEIDSLTDQLKQLESQLLAQKTLNEDKLKRADSVIEFYANLQNWLIGQYGNCEFCEIRSDQSPMDKDGNSVGGKRARDYLASRDKQHHKPD
jgi:hypothetical protein